MKVCFMNNVYLYLVVHTTIHFRNFIKPRRKTKSTIYILEHKPDIVINTYSTTIIQDYYSIFDFDAK